MKKYKQIFFLLLIFALAFAVRLYKIDNPIADWHSWRQADTAAVTRNFIKQGFSPLFPKFDSVVSLNQYANQNPDRFFFAEFPIYNILVYPLYKYFGVNVIYHRLVSVFFSSLTIFSLFFLTKLFSSTFVAYTACLIFALLPYNIYYGRVTMPDPLHVFFAVTSLFFVNLYLKHQKTYLSILSGLFYALTILTKPYGLVLLLPITYLLMSKILTKKPIKILSIILFLIISFTPYLLWKIHIDNYPQGQFGTDWLFNSTNIRFRPAFFRWLVFERFNNLILGGGGFVLVCFGLISPKTKKETLFYFSWLASLAIFLFIIATGNVTHDYYQLPFVPILSIFAALGIEHLLKIGQKTWQKIFNSLLALALFTMMLAMGWYQAKELFNVNNWPIVEAGLKADQILPKDALVIAPYNNDPAFLYQTNRWGWTNQVYDLDQAKQQYQKPLYLVSVSKDDYTNTIKNQYTTIFETNNFIIVKIQ